MKNSLQLPSGYPELLAELSTRIRSAQLRASFAVSRELVLLYWSIGREILERQLSRKRHPGEVIREALGVLRLVQDFSAEKLEQTAALALELGLYGYAAVNDLIKRPSTTASLEKAYSRLGTHPNVRGADYYQ